MAVRVKADDSQGKYLMRLFSLFSLLFRLLDAEPRAPTLMRDEAAPVGRILPPAQALKEAVSLQLCLSEDTWFP